MKNTKYKLWIVNWFIKKYYLEVKTSSCIINESWIDVILLAFCKLKFLWLTNVTFKTGNISLLNYWMYIGVIKRKIFLGFRCTLTMTCDVLSRVACILLNATCKLLDFSEAAEASFLKASAFAFSIVYLSSANSS